MSFFASDDQLAEHEFHCVEDDWSMQKGEKEFVDVATHVGHYEIIRICIPNGGWWTVDDAEKIRDALTRQIYYCRREQARHGRHAS